MKTKVIDRCDGVTSWDVLDNNGNSIGMIQNEVIDANKTSRERRWVVVGYTIELNDGREAYFANPEYGSARAAFAAARKFIDSLD